MNKSIFTEIFFTFGAIIAFVGGIVGVIDIPNLPIGIKIIMIGCLVATLGAGLDEIFK